jgi:outer membrane biosynthesis protein TonB
MKHLGEDTRLTTVQLEVGCVERQIDGFVRRWQILGMASILMEEVCRTFERERQPETLREASSFLNQLTDGKYTRIWTPLGTNKLKIDGDGKSLPLEVLSRGTREAVFIALRLSLAAAYARRGVMLPLVLDDVLVNFDGDRAVHAARTLRTFAELGHQVMMFTCHEHIVDIFHEIDVEVRMLPAQGEPGRATVLLPEEVVEESDEVDYDEEETDEEEVLEDAIEEAEPEPDPVIVEEEPVVVEIEPEPEPEPDPQPRVIYVERPHKKAKPKPRQVRKPKVEVLPPEPMPEPEPTPEPEPVYRAPAASIQWAWFEQETAGQDRRSTARRANQALDAAQRAIDLSQRVTDDGPSDWLIEAPQPEQIPDDVWNRGESWWDGQRVVSPQ